MIVMAKEISLISHTGLVAVEENNRMHLEENVSRLVAFWIDSFHF